jgi:aromatic-L-amino-acid decarboxylase
MINENAKLYTVPALINENYVIRFAVCAQDAVESDIEYAWRTISKEASELLNQRASIESSMEAEKYDQPEEVANEAEYDDV